MSVLNNSLFRIFRDVVYCSVINVLCCRSRDSHVRLTHLFSLVNNFFNLFCTVLFDSFVSRDSFVRLSHPFSFVNDFFCFFQKIYVSISVYGFVFARPTFTVFPLNGAN